MAGMGAENIEEFNLALQGEAALFPWLQEQAGVLSHVEAADVAAALGGLVSEVDRAALTGEFAEFIACTFRRAVSSGIAGWRDDDLAFTRDWGFDLAEIRRPVGVWQANRIGWCRSRTASGWPSTYRMRVFVFTVRRATYRSPWRRSTGSSMTWSR